MDVRLGALKQASASLVYLARLIERVIPVLDRESEQT